MRPVRIHLYVRRIHLLFFFLRDLRPSRSTLFPYTTLFRSNLRYERQILVKGREQEHPEWAEHNKNTKSCESICTILVETTLDRKSTRLNSSHRCISYAVFCLKKKSQLQRTQGRGLCDRRHR